MQQAPLSPATRRLRLALNLALGLAALAALGWVASRFHRFTTGEFTDDAQVQQLLVPVNARVGGYLQAIRFVEFQPVRKGDTLALLDDREFRIQVAQAEAALLDAQAGRGVTSSGLTTVQSNVDVSSASIDEAKARLWNAQQNYARYAHMLADQSVTQQQFEQMKTEYDAAKARLQATERQKQTAQLSTAEFGPRLKSNAAAIKRAQAAVDLARLNLSYCTIVASCAGSVGRKTVEAGQLVQPGQPVADIVSGEEKWVTANFKETQLPGISVGKTARITVDAVPGQVFTGRVVALAGATGAAFSLLPTDNSAGNFVKIQQRVPVRIAFDARNAAPTLARVGAGMNVEVEID